MNLFTRQINNWKDWGRLFQSVPAFAPLVEYIFKKEGLPLTKIENLTPGTNAVFKVGDLVVKIFAPAESGTDQSLDLQTELFAAQWANMTGVSAPRMISNGIVEDRYRFAYIISEYIEGLVFTDSVRNMTGMEKTAFGKNSGQRRIS